MARSEVIDYTAMGKRIQKYREAKGMTQSELAYAIHMTATTVSHIEVGSGKPELNTVIKIANVLETTLDMLLCDSLHIAEIPYKHDISEYMEKCSADELRLIDDIVPSILEAYRRMTKEKVMKFLHL